MTSIRKSINREVATAINSIMSEVYSESQELVPVATGALKASGVFTPAQEETVSDELPEAVITYGNDSVPYAVYVHEELDKYHVAPTQAKYLETPLAQAQKRLNVAIRNATIKGVLKGWRG
jgi:hypothetical protein